MTLLQRTFDGTLEPIAPHPDDMVDCEDTGAYKRRAECVESVDGKFWEDREERYDHERDLVETYFKDFIDWSDEYRASDDCVGEYAHLVWEDRERIMDNVREALGNLLGDEWEDSDGSNDDLIGDVVEALSEHVEFDTTTGYHGYSGLDVVFDSYDIGEVEEQVDINEIELLHDLHVRGDLEEILEDLDSDFCFQQFSHAIYDEKGKFTGKYKHEPIISRGEYPCIMLTNDTSLWYHYGCSEETLETVYNQCKEEMENAV